MKPYETYMLFLFAVVRPWASVLLKLKDLKIVISLLFLTKDGTMGVKGDGGSVFFLLCFFWLVMLLGCLIVCFLSERRCFVLRSFTIFTMKHVYIDAKQKTRTDGKKKKHGTMVVCPRQGPGAVEGVLMSDTSGCPSIELPGGNCWKSVWHPG